VNRRFAVFIGADIGTSSTKAVAIDRSGAVVAEASHPYDFDRPKPGWSEQDPRVWWEATTHVLRRICAQVDPHHVQAVGLSGQMHGSVFLDAESISLAGTHPIGSIRPALMWNDQRTQAECEQIAQAVGGVAELVRRAGNAPLTGFTLPKILWLRAHEPAHYSRLAAVCLPKDFVRLSLTGALASDVGDAAGTLLLDVDRRQWSGELALEVGIDPAVLPPVLESAAKAGQVTQWAARQTGLKAGTPVVAGSGDNQCGGVGAGVVRPGILLVTLGTSGVVFAHSDQCLKDDASPAPGRVHTMCSATGTSTRKGAWTVTGCMLSAAGSLQWARSVLAPHASFDELTAEAADLPPGSDGLLFLPYLTGERCPHADPCARGGWIGLTRSHTRAHLVRSVIEGVCLGMAQVFDVVVSLGLEVREVRIGGGGARSPLWRQTLADAIGHELVTVDNDEGPAFGAALLAGVGVGAFESVQQACANCVRTQSRTAPGPNAPVMRELRAHYNSLYPLLRPTMHALSGR